MLDDAVIEALLRAVEASPDDVVLRLHLADRLVTAGRDGEAIAHCAHALRAEPGDARARSLMARALRTETSSSGEPAEDHSGEGDFDWDRAEQQVELPVVRQDVRRYWEVERSTVTLADVGGLQPVKSRLEAAFLAPLRNPELRSLYRKSLSGGLLLYGPPGCGKTFVARAVAGEMGAQFISVGLADVLDMYTGGTERNIAELFALARRKAPVVVFLDEVDALARRRSRSSSTGGVHQLLLEMDGVDGPNEGVFVLAATNQPWDVDPALRRPGRLDRTIFVAPPDREAREAIFRHHLRQRPVEDVNLRSLARATDGFSGADVAHVCETASEAALLDSVRTGEVRMIGAEDLAAAIRQVRPSTGGWFDLARNVVLYADEDGAWTELRTWMKKAKRL